LLHSFQLVDRVVDQVVDRSVAAVDWTMEASQVDLTRVSSILTSLEVDNSLRDDIAGLLVQLRRISVVEVSILEANTYFVHDKVPLLELLLPPMHVILS
jgi:hypothetical protein